MRTARLFCTFTLVSICIAQTGWSQTNDINIDKTAWMSSNIKEASSREPIRDTKIAVRDTKMSVCARTLEDALTAADYHEQAWYLIDGGLAPVNPKGNPHSVIGVAVVTRIEQCNEKGETIKDQGRFSYQFNPRQTSFVECVRAAISKQPKGHFRAFLFAIMNDANRSPWQGAGEDTVEYMDNNFVKAAMRTSEFTSLQNFHSCNNVVYAYVYEFTKGADDKKFTFVKHPALDCRTQLKMSGIYAHLMSAKPSHE